jgi:predicted RND superfamily exporter protein
MSDIYDKIARLSGIRSRRYIFIVIVCMVVLAASAWRSLMIRINGDISALAPENTPSVQTIREMEKRFGATNTLMVIVLAPRGKDMTKKLDVLAASIGKSPHVKRIDYRMDTTFFENRGLYFLTEKELADLKNNIKDRIKEETIKSNPFYFDLDTDEEKAQKKAEPIDSAKVANRFEGASYVKDGYFRKVVDGGKREAWGLIITPTRGTADMNYAKALVEDVQSRIDSARLGKDIEVYMSGRYHYLAKEAKQVFADLRLISSLSTVAVIVAVFCFFPNIFSIFLIFIPLILGLAIDFAIVQFSIGELNLITSGTFSILFGIGVAYGVHTYARFREERKLGHTYEDAMDTSVGDTGRAIFGSASTTAVAFFALTVARYKGFSQLGFITGIGVVFSFVTALIVMPAIGKPMHLWKLLRKHRVTGTTTEDLVRGWGETPPLTRFTFVTGVAITGLSIFLLTRLGYEMDYNKLTIKDEKREIAQHYERALFGMSGEPAVTYTDNEKELRALVLYLERLKKGKGKELIEKVVSAASLIPERQEEKRAVIGEIRDLVYDKKLNLAEGKEKQSVEKLRRMADARPFGIKDIPADVKNRFEGKDGGFVVYIYPKKDITNLVEAMKMEAILTGMKIGGRSISASNTTIVFSSMQNLMLDDAPWVISLSFVAVFLCVLLTFRSLKDSLLAMIPLIIGLTWMMGFMKLTGQKINFFNIIAIPAVIGIGVDNGVHIVHRYRVEGLASMKRIVRNLGRTLLAATLTTMLGFSALLFAAHPGVKTLGAAAASGLFTTFLSAVFFLPAVIYVTARVMARRTLRRRDRLTLWTLSFDPVTEFIESELKARGIDHGIVSLDEMPSVERATAVKMLKEKGGQELFLPLVETKGEFHHAGRMGLAEVRELIDHIR